ncbi:putative Transmembrane protein [Quillaja saponaria]|uniref:Transmembrane protein n=1 Tax=Quillaja saponaria TaxID=32244 RepID=A0AAD7PI42_QUISA|nr:putative Transmembrane protein [Quillaja saponaria]
MEKIGKILRSSIHIFLQNYHYFTSTAALLAFPFSVSVLLSQALVPASPPPLPTIYNRLRTLFDAAGFPSSSQFFTILSQKLSETIFSHIFTLPFTLTFLLIAKACIIQSLNHTKPTSPHSFTSIISIYKPILLTFLCNSFLILSANTTFFCLIFFVFNFFDGFGFSSSNFLLFLSAAGAVLYSIIVANTFVICNLALILSGMEGCGGYISILKACVLIRGRTSMALFLALPVNLALAAIEALFHFRVMRAFIFAEKPASSIIIEGIFIAYLYSIFIVLDTIVNYMFFKSCKAASSINQEGENFYRIEFSEKGNCNYYVSIQNFEELP